MCVGLCTAWMNYVATSLINSFYNPPSHLWRESNCFHQLMNEWRVDTRTFCVRMANLSFKSYVVQTIVHCVVVSARGRQYYLRTIQCWFMGLTMADWALEHKNAKWISRECYLKAINKKIRQLISNPADLTRLPQWYVLLVCNQFSQSELGIWMAG